MKYTPYVLFGVLLIPTAAVLLAAALSLAVPETSSAPAAAVPQYLELENQP